MSLSIGWASPWNVRSAIALFGTEIVAELVARGHSVDVLRTEVGKGVELAARPAPGRVLALGQLDVARLQREYDVVVVNLGDHYEFHGAAVRALPKLGAVAILHDSFYANLVAGAYTQSETAAAPEGPVLQRIVQATYGKEAMPPHQHFWLPEPEMHSFRTMLEWISSPIIGAVVHSEHYADRVRRFCPGPVAEIPLAHADPGVPPPRPIGDEVMIMTVGHVNPNKCVDRVIMAIAESDELRRRCRYRLIGPYEDGERERLLALATELEVAPPEFAGRIEDPDFAKALGAADVICCLRNPVLEGGSGSAVIGMLSGRPMLVSDHGSYAEIPDGLVAKCAPGRETGDVARYLQAILDDPQAAQEMGQRARDYALRRHSPGAYVEALLPFLERAIRGGPAIMASLAIGRTLAAFNLEPQDAAVARAIEPLQSMLGMSKAQEPAR